MEAKNVCPYCGSYDLTLTYGANSKPFFLCNDCSAAGPWATTKQKALHVFTYPEALMANLHTFDPSTHVVVSREAAASVLELIDAWAERLNNLEAKPTWGIVPDYDPNVAELRAALEVK